MGELEYKIKRHRLLGKGWILSQAFLNSCSSGQKDGFRMG